ncbi:hypothetical protein A2215_01165 [Candidatus Berkelbacteria bacterium RIFOXYA2_FULL_43_10]|uniref:Uncharacterized protein n=1 Tax=Candidatus Berkelbacteria bacterium RIFOXYA2_FULL_43_10 TaxID=1797472 RepID=A0A1F5EE48_9BACT|nr:MAG: hypothetical protein A2215_01165 [Candidatus Berkelbacteria bacterium RIFOXYA2_FULL_43_10]
MINIKKISKRKNVDYFLVALTIVIGFYLGWAVLKVALLTFVVWQILYPLPSKTLAKAIIFALLLFPALVITNFNNRSEDAGVLVFCLLVATLIMTIVEFVKLDKTSPIE